MAVKPQKLNVIKLLSIKFNDILVLKQNNRNNADKFFFFSLDKILIKNSALIISSDYFPFLCVCVLCRQLFTPS